MNTLKSLVLSIPIVAISVLGHGQSIKTEIKIGKTTFMGSSQVNIYSGDKITVVFTLPTSSKGSPNLQTISADLCDDNRQVQQQNPELEILYEKGQSPKPAMGSLLIKNNKVFYSFYTQDRLLVACEKQSFILKFEFVYKNKPQDISCQFNYVKGKRNQQGQERQE